MAKKDHQPIVLIMAGGKGERFWPRSRESCPKQLQRVYSDSTLLEETIVRARTVTALDNIFVGCNGDLKRAILRTHKFPAKNFIVEPEGRNTAPIIALAALELERRFPGRVQLIMSADHFITPKAEFRRTVERALGLAERGFLVTLGIRPTRPDTGYGYICTGKELWDTGGFVIQSFKEKPDQKSALRYIRQENYFWNSGIFLWKGDVILSEFETHAPKILAPLKKAGRSQSALKKAFARIPKEPVDTAIMEKSRRVAMLPASFSWDDVGSWLSLERIVEQRSDGNVLVSGGKKSALTAHNASGNIVVSEGRPVFLLGVNDTVIVEEPDLLFVTSKTGVGDIKELTARLRSNKALQRFLR